MGAVQILTHSMVQSIEENSVRKGYDPRDFALVAEGGAGPAVRRADRARGRDAVGARPAAPRHHVGDGPARDGHGLRVRLDRLPAALAARRGGAPARSSTSSRSRRAPSSRRTASRRTACSIQRVADCRYLGQGYELRVDVELRRDRRRRGSRRLRASFHDIHEREYSRRFEDSDIEIPNVRVRGIGLMPPLETPEVEQGPESPEAALRYERDAWFRVRGELAQVPTRFYDRAALRRATASTARRSSTSTTRRR